MVDPLLKEEMEIDDEMEEEEGEEDKPIDRIGKGVKEDEFEEEEEEEVVQCEPDIGFEISKQCLSSWESSHNSSQIPCNQCSLTFPNKISLNLHLLRVHVVSSETQQPLPSCPICGQTPSTDLTAHCRKEHAIDGVVCPICAKILSKTCTLNRHLEQVHLNLQIHKPATCTTCGKVFSKKGHLDRHIRTIHMGIKETSQPCPFCGKIFSTKSSLDPHIDMVHKGVRRECPTCGKVLSDLWKHMRTVHGYYRRKAKVPKEEEMENDP